MNLRRTFNLIALNAKKLAPHIALGVGVGGVIVGTVEACKATRNLDTVIEDHNFRLVEVKKEIGIDENNDIVTNDQTDDGKKEITKVYTKTAGELVKLYAKPTLIISGSIALIIGSHVSLNKRNVALGAAYAAIDSSFKKYRENVVEKYGKEIDDEMQYGIKLVKKKGEEEPVAKVVKKESVGNGYDTVLFDKLNAPGNFQCDFLSNITFIQQVENYCKQQFRSNGYLFINDVLKSLGIEPKINGQIDGWLYDPKAKPGTNEPELRIINLEDMEINGEPVALIEFKNVQRNILGKADIKKYMFTR